MQAVVQNGFTMSHYVPVVAKRLHYLSARKNCASKRQQSNMPPKQRRRSLSPTAPPIARDPRGAAPESSRMLLLRQPKTHRRFPFTLDTVRSAEGLSKRIYDASSDPRISAPTPKWFHLIPFAQPTSPSRPDSVAASVPLRPTPS